MRKIIYLIPFSMLVLISLSSCGNASSNDKSENNSAEATQSNSFKSSENKIDSTLIKKNEPIEKKEPTVIKEYQLKSVTFSGGTAGGNCEFDEKKKLWCERPSGASIMSYAQTNGMEDFSKIPIDELSNYFGKKESKLLNSCKITLTSIGDSSVFSLSFNDKIVYENNFSKTNKKSLKSNRLKNFNLPVEAGTMVLDGARNYEFIIENPPKINFSNDFGQFELGFKQIK